MLWPLCRQTWRWNSMMLCVVFLALLANALAMPYHITIHASAPASEFFADTHDDISCTDNATAHGPSSRPALSVRIHPRREGISARILCASIFHPPQAR